MARAKQAKLKKHSTRKVPLQSEEPKAKPLKNPVTEAALTNIAKLHCTIEEAASFFGCTKRHLLRLFQESAELRAAWEEGRQFGKFSLRRLQWRHANRDGSGGVTMTIHLSKHWLGETEKSLVEIDHRILAINPEKLNDEQLAFLETILVASAPGPDDGGQTDRGDGGPGSRALLPPPDRDTEER
jgi:AraC-like DNA-binding protein